MGARDLGETLGKYLYAPFHFLTIDPNTLDASDWVALIDGLARAVEVGTAPDSSLGRSLAVPISPRVYAGREEPTFVVIEVDSPDTED